MDPAMDPLIGILAGMLSLSGCTKADPALARYAFEEPHMGTRFQIVLYAQDDNVARQVSKAAFDRIATLDGIMSDYRSTSELMRLCQRAGGEPVHVSDELFFVLTEAQKVAQLSEGAFDVTVGPVVRLWRKARRTQQLPDAGQLARARALVGYDKVRLDEAKHTVTLLKAGMQLDLGGIAKGYAADEALAVLKKHGITRALVAAGGDIAVSGPPPDSPGWTVGIGPLEDPGKKPERFLILKHAAVSTSGDAEQHVEIDGKRYSHIVDPRTGLGLIGRQSVTVVAPRGIQSDSLTKVVSVLGPQRGLAIVDKMDGVAALVNRLTDRGMETIASKHFAEIPQKGPR
jgi:thiamine biosynthesis lipoprotein